MDTHRRTALQAEAARLRQAAARIRTSAQHVDSRDAYNADMREAARLDALAAQRDAEAQEGE